MRCSFKNVLNSRDRGMLFYSYIEFYIKMVEYRETFFGRIIF
jgi:hypothetical protein